MEMSDADYVKLAKLGLKGAFGKLVDHYRDVVFSICFDRCGNFADAQDMAQEAFIRAYTCLDQLREPEKFAHWLFRITYAVCSNSLRSKPANSFPLEDKIFEFPLRDIVEDEVMKQETHRLIGDAIRQLPETYKLAAMLHYLGGHDYKEISQILGCSVGTIKVRLMRARKMLKDQLFNRLFEDAKVSSHSKSITRKVLSGIASLEKEEIFSHMRSIKAVIEYDGGRVDWDCLLGMSGEAFCMYFGNIWTYHTRFMHSWDVASRACKAFGYKGTWYSGQSFEYSLDLLEKCIQRGIPAIAPGINPSVSECGGSECHFWFLVTGVDRENKRMTLAGVGEQDATVPYPRKMNAAKPEFEWSGITRCLIRHPEYLAINPIFVMEPHQNSQDIEGNALESLRFAVQLAYEKPVHWVGRNPVIYYGGIDAFKQMRYGLLEEAKAGFKLKDQESSIDTGIGETLLGICKRIEVSRRAAASYVHTLAESKVGLPASCFAKVANHYEEVATQAQKLFELYFDPQQYAEMQKVITKYPKPLYFTSEEGNRFWNTFRTRLQEEPNRLNEGAEIVGAMADKEKAAVKLLDSIIAEWGDISIKKNNTQDQYQR